VDNRLTADKKSSRTKSVRCVRDVRNIPLADYRLPDDGRQWKKLAVIRQRLANFLATFADASGERIFPSEKTMSTFLGCHRATTYRTLADLEKLGLLKPKSGKVDKSGQPNKHGTALRAMDVEGFLAARVNVASSDVNVASSDVVEVASSDVNVASSTLKVASSTVNVAPSCDTTVLDRLKTVHQPTQPKQDGWEEVFKTKAATLDVFIQPKHMVVIRTLVESEEHGVQFLMLALDDFKHRDLTGMKRPAVAVFMEEFEGRFTKMKQQCLSSSDWRYAHDPAVRERQERSNREQDAKDLAFVRELPDKNYVETEAEIEELLAE
jgi:hypothetical protein